MSPGTETKLRAGAKAAALTLGAGICFGAGILGMAAVEVSYRASKHPDPVTLSKLCAPRGEADQALRSQANQEPVFLALTDDGRIVEVWISSWTGRFTVITTSPDKTTCQEMTGNSWRLLLKNQDEKT